MVAAERSSVQNAWKEFLVITTRIMTLQINKVG